MSSATNTSTVASTGREGGQNGTVVRAAVGCARTVCQRTVWLQLAPARDRRVGVTDYRAQYCDNCAAAAGGGWGGGVAMWLASLLTLLAGLLGATTATAQDAVAQRVGRNASGQVGVEVRELLRILLSLSESPSKQWAGLSWLVANPYAPVMM